ncbi:hypothetical protein QTP88_024559 [Uroleucon formosanum]
MQIFPPANTLLLYVARRNSADTEENMFLDLCEHQPNPSDLSSAAASSHTHQDNYNNAAMNDSSDGLINFPFLIRSVLVILQVITTLINALTKLYTVPSKCIMLGPDINRYKKRLREYGFNYYLII